MDPYVAGARGDTSGRDRTSTWSSAQRRRSRSPTRIQRDRMPDHLVPHPTDRDWDAPPAVLPRKPKAAVAQVSQNPAPGPPIRTDSSGTRRVSSSSSSRAELISRLMASVQDRSLLTRIEAKRDSISEDRTELNVQLKKVKQLQDHLAKSSASTDQRIVAKLREHQQAHAALEQKIAVSSEELHRMQFESQLSIAEFLFPDLVASATLPPDPRLEDLRSEVRADQRDFDTKLRTATGQIGRFQSDFNKVKADIVAQGKDTDRFRQELYETRDKLRKDVDKDVAQIADNQSRIRRLEKDVSSLRSNVASASRSTSDAPTSPRAPQASFARAASPTRDPRLPSTPKAPSTADAADAAAATSGTSEVTPATAEPASAPTAPKPEAAPVTRAQFRKWIGNFQSDLELRLEEVKDLAVQEATFENQACMEDRLRSLVRKHRRHLADSAGKQSESDPAQQPPADSDAAIAASGIAPMDVDSTATRNPTSSPEVVAVVETSSVQPPAASTSAQSPNPAEANETGSAATAPSTTARPAADQRASSDAVATPTPQPDSTAAAAPAPVTTRTISSPTSNLASPPAPSVPSDAKTQSNGLPASLLQTLHSVLEAHKEQIRMIKKEVDALRSLEPKVFGDLLKSPEQLKQLVSALKHEGLDAAAPPALPAASSAFASNEVSSLRDVQKSLVERIQALELWKTDFVAFFTTRTDWLQRQHELLDDQSSLQGALLIKLAEHANPRRQSAPDARNSAATRSLVPPTPRAVPPPPPPQLQQQQPPSHQHQQQHQQQHLQQHPQQHQHPQQPQQQQQHVARSVLAGHQSAADVAALSAAHMVGGFAPPNMHQLHP